ncbi:MULTISPECIES: hypothetical protein [Lichenihabitans]|uniref:hypothetical protein n=1 Tax=Lichenihabitans TaxID=2723776 RepID=UPI001036429A|nr:MULTISPECIES: hypothetical protein [Lichenihabitans]UDL94444.1 hypothetical protein LGH83_18385 [Lichenihabitans sp. PAMC28606]
MAAQKKLARFEVDSAGKEFVLHVEDESGNKLEMLASRDQLDVIADSLDDILLQDDSADEVTDSK